jgi:hypothetical protein
MGNNHTTENNASDLDKIKKLLIQNPGLVGPALADPDIINTVAGRMTSKVKVILPTPAVPDGFTPILTLPDTDPAKLERVLKKRFIKDTDTYKGLYATPNSLNFDAVSRLFGERKWSRAIPFPDAQRNKGLGNNPFKGGASLDGMIDPIIQCLKAQVQISNREFCMRDDDEKRTHCDCRDKVKEEVLSVQSDVGGFLLECGRSKQEKRAVVSQGDAGLWIKGPLKRNMMAVADLAKAHNIIFHEPHHELTPGMLLIDEIFRRMVNEVAALLDEIKGISVQDKDLGPLQKFVDDLATGQGNFGPYILPAGDHVPPLFPRQAKMIKKEGTYHVDPSRIELFLDPTGCIRAASVIVGAWAGGTHSAGHTSP